MYGNIRPEIVRVAEQTVVNLKELESRIEVLKNDLAALCVQVGHPEAARLAATPVQWLGAANMSALGNANVGSFGATQVSPGVSPFATPFAQTPLSQTPFVQNPFSTFGFSAGASPFGLSPFAQPTGFSPFAQATGFSPFAQATGISPFAQNPYAAFGAFGTSSPYATPLNQQGTPLIIR